MWLKAMSETWLWNEHDEPEAKCYSFTGRFDGLTNCEEWSTGQQEGVPQSDPALLFSKNW
jgi:hypothetical protein